MPRKRQVAKELADFLGVFSHPDRIRLVEELRSGESDVHGLQERLGLSQSRVSQHLAVLRARWVVTERRESRHVYYRLRQPDLADWITTGLELLERQFEAVGRRRDDLEEVRLLWSGGSTSPTS